MSGQRGLAPLLLDHRLDQERGAAELVKVGHDPDTVEIEAVQLRADLCHARAGAMRRIARAGPQQHLVVLGCRHSQAARNNA
jgi:hypothetical protein